MLVLRLALLLVLGGIVSGSARAQDEPENEELAAFRAMVNSDPFTGAADDPMGIDSHTRSLETMRLPPQHAVVGTRIPPREGPVLTAIPGVSERAHRIGIRLRAGFALVTEELEFESSAHRPAEVLETLAVPADASIAGLRVCLRTDDEERCREGVPDLHAGELSAYDDWIRGATPSDALPIAHGEVNGEVLRLRAAPLPAGRSARLVVHVSWMSAVEIRGGVVDWAIPARGQDARVVAPEVRVDAFDLVAPRINDQPADRTRIASELDQPIRIVAELPRSAEAHAERLRVRCGAVWCEHFRFIGSRSRTADNDIVLALDASPSTVAGARGRIASAARSILDALPASSRVFPIAFAERTEALGSGWVVPSEVDDAWLRAIPYRELGVATRIERVLTAIPTDARAARVIIIGDGGISVSRASSESVRRAESRGIRIFSINVADRESRPELARLIGAARTLDVGPQADALTRGRDSFGFERAVRASLAEVDLERVWLRASGALRVRQALGSGEEIRWQGQGRATSSLRAETVELDPLERRAFENRFAGVRAWIAVPARARTHAGTCAVRESFDERSGISPRADPVAMAHRRQCLDDAGDDSRGDDTASASSAGPSPSAMVPRQSILGMLRVRVVPLARACLRSDRRGRGAYQVRAEYELVLADREIESVEVHGRIDSRLRTCLEQAVHQLDIPPFEGRLRIRWPLHTAPTLPPPVMELEPTLAEAVDELLEPDAP